jgi:monoamine oxidase
MTDTYDVVVIGAGAAGVAAGRILAQAQRSYLIVEARGRIGGRAYTVQRNNFALDLGCAWLHAAARNVWRAAAERAGFALDRAPAPWERGALPERAAFAAAFARFSERIERAANAPDRPASAYLEPGEAANDMIDAICTYLNGVRLDRVSAHDYVRYDGAGGNQRAPMGYGALIAALGAGLPIALNTQARRIDHSAATIRVETDRGALDARTLIVATPTPILADETLRFTPALPAIVNAAAGLPLGVVDKMFIGFDDAPPELGSMIGRVSLTRPSYEVRPLGRPLIEAFIAGPLAQELERDGQRAAEAFVIDDLADLLGADVRPKLTVLASSSWAREPFSRGSYSYAKPGCAEARAALARPTAERIFFAGEACAPHFFGTAHGAAETGCAAARLALDHLSRVSAV